MSIGRKYGTVIMGLICLMVIIASACGSENTPSSSEVRHINIQIEEGEASGVGAKVSINKGDDVKISFTSDEHLTVHLHGYDIKEDVPKGGEAVMEFNANATGRFVITSHQPSDEGDDSHSGHMPNDMNSSKHDGHGDLFESKTLVKGDTFSYIIPSDMEDTEIPYHDHMAHEQSALIVVSKHHGREGIVAINVADSSRMYQPVEVNVKPGATVEWTIGRDAKVRLTSGFPPASSHGGSVKEDVHEEQEKTLVAIEVRP